MSLDSSESAVKSVGVVWRCEVCSVTLLVVDWVY